MDTAWGTAVLVAISTIIGAAIGFAGSYLGAIRVENKRHFREAANKFRSAFVREMVRLLPSVSDDSNPSEFLKKAFPRHWAAVWEFYDCLPKTRRAEFHRTWQEYYRQGKDSADFPFFEQYSSVGCSSEKAQERKKSAYERLEKLLAFTDQGEKS